MHEHEPNFQDAQLKASVQTLERNHKAAPGLRERVARQMADLRGSKTNDASDRLRIVPATRARNPLPIRWRFGRLAAAAALFLVIGGGTAGYVYYRHVQDEREEYARNDAVFDAMVDLEEAGAAGNAGSRPFKMPLTNLTALRQEAHDEVARFVPAPEFARDGWTMDAASVSPVAGSMGVRFHFARGAQSMIVLSLPASAYKGERDQYQLVIDGHALAGYMREGSLNCIIGDESLKLAEVTQLRDQLRTMQ